MANISREADVIVVGAGILGAFHAYFAALKGLRVLLLERNALPSDASVRNFGMVPQSIVNPLGEWASFAEDTAGIYSELQDRHDLSVSERGSLYVASTDLESQVIQEFAQHFSHRYRCWFLSPGEVAAHYPLIQDTYVRGGLLFPEDLGLDPRVMMAQLLQYLGALGVEYVPYSNVLGVDIHGNTCAIQTADGLSYKANHVFLCSGADGITLFPEVFASSGLRVCKLQMMRTVPLQNVTLRHSLLSGLSIRRYPAFISCPSYPLLQAEAMDEKLRAYGVHVLIKQEADGSVVIGDSHQYASISDASSLHERTDSDINESILGYARSMVRLPSWQLQSLWNGYYLVHPTDPIFATTIDHRIHIVTGIGGKGMSTGPGFARHSIKAMFG